MEDAVLLAARCLRVSAEEASVNMKSLPELDSTYFWQDRRNGGALIVGSDGTALFAGSSIPFDTHFDAFKSGLRTNKAMFSNA